MSELNDMTAREMARLVHIKEISSIDLIEDHLSRIDKLNPTLNAFTFIDAERARSAVQKARGPLHGVPISIKASIDVAGFPTESGTRLRKGIVATTNAPVVARLKAAGAIILGNTNTPEMLMAYETDNLLYGRTNHPLDLQRTPGGSSGGEAAAIASGCSAAGIGSDGGGSIRIPAHFSGICGLKPTPGRIPGTGHFPACVGPFALLGVVGPMARSVGDLKLLFEVIAGPDNGDPCSAPVPVRWPRREDLRRLRVGYFEDDGRTAVTPETKLAVQKAARVLTDSGFEVVPFRPDGLERARQLWWTLFGGGGSFVLKAMYEGRESEMSPILREFMEYASTEPPLTAERLMNTLFERDQLRASFLAQIDRYPILLTPVCSVPAFRHRERSWKIGNQDVQYLDAMSYSQWFNLLGNPAAVVPVGKSPENLPIGVQVVGRPFEEEIVLEIAGVIEEGCGGRRV